MVIDAEPRRGRRARKPRDGRGGVEIGEGQVTRLDYACSIDASNRSVLGLAPQRAPDPRSPLKFAAFVITFVTVVVLVRLIVSLW